MKTRLRRSKKKRKKSNHNPKLTRMEMMMKKMRKKLNRFLKKTNVEQRKQPKKKKKLKMQLGKRTMVLCLSVTHVKESSHLGISLCNISMRLVMP